MNIICFIPARAGSKSVPQKNIKMLGGKPLIAWTIETAFKSGLQRVIVNTDGEEIAKVAREYGAEVMIRPANLAQDNSAMVDVLKAEIFKIDPLPDVVLLLQPTCPFRNVVQIKIAISYLIESLDKYDSLISVEQVPDKYNPYAMIVENSGKKMLFRKLIGVKEKLTSLFTGKKFIASLSGFPISQRMTRRQDFPQTWIPDGSIYLFKTENLKQGSIYGKNTMLLETEGTLNINTLEDFEEAERSLTV